MGHPGRLVIWLLLTVASATCWAAGSKYRVEDPAGAQRVDYLIIAGDKFVDHVDALAAHRAGQGYAVGVVKMSAVRAKFPSIRAFLAHAVRTWKKPPPAYLLLVGDVDTVPTVVKKGALRGWMSSPDLATDFDYARPLGARIHLHVGRFPCDTARELATMIRKTIDYETQLPGGAWQRKLNFVASVGGFGKEVDKLLEGIGMQISTGSVPAGFDMQAAYGSPNSPYCPYPPAFNRHVVEMFNAGSLLYLFVGHGSARSVATVRWRGRSYPIFSDRDADSLNARHGLPVFVVIACHTGRYDRSDCLGEMYLKAARGPVAFLGGSRVTQPYANALFAKAFVDAFFGRTRTLGEAVTLTKRVVLAHPFSLFRVQVDAVAAEMQGKKALKPMREDVVRHYNLLGDPALVLRKPRRDIGLVLKGSAVHVTAPGRRSVELSLEHHRLAFARRLPAIKADDPQFEKKITERYRKAHNLVLKRWTVQLKDGKGTTAFTVPGPGKYVLKAASRGSIGSVPVVGADPGGPP